MGSEQKSRFDSVLEDLWQFRLKSFPEFATTVAVYKYDDKLDSVSDIALESRTEAAKTFLKQIDQIQPEHLDPVDKVTWRLTKDVLEDLVR